MNTTGKRFVLIAVCLGLGFVLGVSFDRWWRDDNQVEVGGGTDSETRAQEIDETGQADRRSGIQELRAENARLREKIAQFRAARAAKSLVAETEEGGDQRHDKYTPLAWPEDTPAAFGPDQFEQIFKAIVEEADGEMELLDILCDEPPCMAVFRVPPATDGEDYSKKYLGPLVETDTWKKHYDKMLGVQGTRAHCGDGRSERVSFVWKTPDTWDENFIDDMIARRWIRAETILDNWKCLPEQDKRQVLQDPRSKVENPP